MFDSIVETVIGLLRDRGLNAVRQYREELLGRGSESLVCVGLKSGSLKSSGAGEYLGLMTDERTGDVSELFGFRAELTLAADIFARRAEGCAKQLDRLGELMSLLPSGIREAEISGGEIRPDEDTGMYYLPAELKCAAYVCAERDEDSGQFRDFVLRGVLR